MREGERGRGRVEKGRRRRERWEMEIKRKKGGVNGGKDDGWRKGERMKEGRKN